MNQIVQNSSQRTHRIIVGSDTLRTTTRKVTEAYEFCRKVTLEHAKTFYFASFFLPKEKRNACYAVYAFCRYIDDLIDEQVATTGGHACAEGIRATVDRWQSGLDMVYAGRTPQTPILLAWGDILSRYHISRLLPDELIEGVMSDLRPNVRYATFDELYAYCYKVASIVGLMTSEIFGYSDPATRGYAVDLGIAMQLTNIIRDVREDYENSRIYLPQDELKRFGVTEQDIQERRMTAELEKLLQFQIERARMYYRRADIGIEMLEQDSRLTVRLMSYNYERILSVVERNGYDVFSRRASVSFRSKLLAIPALWYATIKTRAA